MNYKYNYNNVAAYLQSCSRNDACVTFLLINTICSIDVQVFTDPVIVLSFMLPFIYFIVRSFRVEANLCSFFLSFAYICIAVEIQLSRWEGYDPTKV